MTEKQTRAHANAREEVLEGSLVAWWDFPPKMWDIKMPVKFVI